MGVSYFHMHDTRNPVRVEGVFDEQVQYTPESAASVPQDPDLPRWSRFATPPARLHPRSDRRRHQFWRWSSHRCSSECADDREVLSDSNERLTLVVNSNIKPFGSLKRRDRDVPGFLSVFATPAPSNLRLNCCTVASPSTSKATWR
jgi:hypothetical protein